jgi:hypothetical protein
MIVRFVSSVPLQRSFEELTVGELRKLHEAALSL